jgi:hypothetical protein
VPREAFEEVEALGKKHWAYTQVLKVKMLGKNMVV